jgi:hypothetical protein
MGFNSRVDLEGSAPIERLLVFTSLTKETYDGFQAGMTNMLEGCGIGSRILNSGGLEESPDFQVARREFQPSTDLAIGLVRGTLLEGVESRLVFELRLLDIGSGKLTWLARMEVSIKPRTKDRDFGASFAASIIARLRADGVLKACPRTRSSTTSARAAAWSPTPRAAARRLGGSAIAPGGDELGW